MSRPSIVKSPDLLTRCALFAAWLNLMTIWSAGCSLFRSHQATVQPTATPSAPQHVAPVTRPRVLVRPARTRSVPVSVTEPSQPALQSKPLLPAMTPQPPTPLVTLGNGDAKADTQKLVQQVAFNLAHTRQAELPAGAASTYQQALQLITAAQQALADQDYAAASSLAAKASALTNQLPSAK